MKNPAVAPVRSSVKIFEVLMNNRSPEITAVTAMVPRGRRSGPKSRLSDRENGSSLARALAQMARETAAWTAIMLAVKPMANMTSNVRPIPEPRRFSSVVAIGFGVLARQRRPQVGDGQDEPQRRVHDEQPGRKERQGYGFGQDAAGPLDLLGDGSRGLESDEGEPGDGNDAEERCEQPAGPVVGTRPAPARSWPEALTRLAGCAGLGYGVVAYSASARSAGADR